MVSNGKRVGLDIRKIFFTVRAVRCCNSLFSEILGLPSLKVFKTRLGGTYGRGIGIK